MPQCCAVPKCSNKKGGHKFPKDKIRLKQWIAAIRRDFSPTKNSLICKDHFSIDDYELPKDSVYDNPRLKLKKTAVPSRFPWSKETNDFLQKRKERTEHSWKYSLQKKFLPQDKSSSSNSPMTFGTSPLLVNTDSINKNPKEKNTVPFEHKHVLKLLHDKQYFCDVCHKKFTRLSPQGLHKKHTNVKTEAAPVVPGASDLTVPFIKQEKEVEYFDDEMENKEDCGNEISTDSEDKFTSNETEGPSAVVANNMSYATTPPVHIQKPEIKVECIEVEVEKKEDYENESIEPIESILDETSTVHKNNPKKPKTCDKPYSCVCGRKFTYATWLNEHKARYNHYKDNSSDIKKEDVRTEVTSGVASDANDLLVPPAFVKHEIKEEYSVNENPKEKTTVSFEHKHVLKLLHDQQYFCDVCHKRFTRLSPQGLRNKHTNVKTEVAPVVPGASDSTVPFIKQEKEVEFVEVEIEVNNWENVTHEERKDLREHTDCVKAYQPDDKCAKSQKPHSCDVCGKSFAFKSWLTNHMKTHNNKHECDVCKLKFRNIKYLERHKDIAHSEVISFHFDCGTLSNV